MRPKNLSSLGDLKRDPRNPRKHGERNIQQIEQSLKNFGAGRSIVIDEKNQILAGNGLVEAAGNIGLSKLVVVDATGEEIVAVRRRGLTDKQKTEYRIADNRSAELAEWDVETLQAMAEEIDLEQFWSDEELEALLAQEPEQSDVDAEPQTDRAAELQEKWKVERGQIWQLGNCHRLMCGDSTDKTHVGALLQDCRPFLMVADPPYGMHLDTDYSKLPSTKPQGNHTFTRIVGDDIAFDCRVIESDATEQFWFGADYYAKTLPEGGSWLVWDKRVDEKFDAMFGSGFELIWSKVKHKREIIRCNNTLFSGEVEARGKLHPTVKPTKVIRWILERFSKEGNLIVDYFLGAGTTICAAEQLNRTCYGMEIEPKYVAVCLQRFQDATQKEPKLLK